MWVRKTFHECTSSLRAICADFRAAYEGRVPGGEERKRWVMVDTSQKGVQILQAMALTVRGEQDYGIVDGRALRVGALLSDATSADVQHALHVYQPPHSALTAPYGALTLREGLNKVAHADPMNASFRVGEGVHDLVLTGSYGNRRWVAILSLLDLCTAVESLPDRALLNPV